MEKDYQRAHDVRRHWLRELKASGEYDVLVAKQLEAWRSAADGTVPQTLLQAYRDEMAQLLADLTAKHKQAVRSAKSARTKLQLHARLVTQWPITVQGRL